MSWASRPMLWVLRDGVVVGAVLPLPDGPAGEPSPRWLASACDEMGGGCWPCESQAAAVEWLMQRAR